MLVLKYILIMKQQNIFKILMYSLLFVFPLAILGQTISGKITDASGQGLPFINILEKGTTNGITSEMSGAFSLTVKQLQQH